MVNLSIPRAVDGNRTHDLFLTKEVLYQLSYNSGHERQSPIIWGGSGRWDLNPRQPAWKAGALPLSYTRTLISDCRSRTGKRAGRPACLSVRNPKSANPVSGWRGIRTPELVRGQIYSLVQLTTLPSTRLRHPRRGCGTPQSHRWGSNPRPTVYKTVALPLCYDGGLRESINIGSPGTPTRFGAPAAGKNVPRAKASWNWRPKSAGGFGGCRWAGRRIAFGTK